MRTFPGFVAVALLPAALLAQATPTYRGFATGVAYRDFAERARALARPGDLLVCNTGRKSAQIMECGVLIKDSTDGASFYLTAFVIEGKIAIVSLGDSGTAALVDRTKGDLAQHFGAPRQIRAGMWEWRSGRKATRFSWRGRGSTRWIYIQLQDDALVDDIARYARASR